MFRNAVERNFEIIGEAISRLARLDPNAASQIGDYQRIIAFRNLLIHGYDLVDHQLVWKVMQEQLPALLNEVLALLRDAPQ